MRSKFLIFLLPVLVSVFGAVLAPTFAQDQSSGWARTGQILSPSLYATDYSRSELISEKAGVMPGETIFLGLHQQLEPDWHVFWKNSGDSGFPLVMSWDLPEGFVVGDIQYPVPHSLPLGPLINYVYEDEVTFLVPITVPETAVPSTVATIALQASWAICSDICVPEQADLRLALPIVASSMKSEGEGARVIVSAKASLPKEVSFTSVSFDLDGRPVLHLQTDQFDTETDFSFFPNQAGLVKPAGTQQVVSKGPGFSLYMVPGFDYAPDMLKNLDGVLAVGRGRDYRGYQISAPVGPVPDDLAAPDLPAEPAKNGGSIVASGPGFLAILGLAFLGGLILNIMPCVFPVVFLKAAGIVRIAHEDLSTVRLHGMLYTAGILLAFLAIASLLIFLRAGGEQLGWGFHLQSPITVSVFSVVIFLVGLNLAGLFDVGTSVQGVGSDLAAQGGKAGAFFTGLLAVAVAAPCIGPFLGVPLGYALSQPALVGLGVFAMMGLGLAAPYLLISFVPGLAKLLPKPGVWMETFRQVLSFAMFATLIWLIWTVSLQAGPDGLVLVLIALLLAGFAAWAFGRAQRTTASGLVGRGLALVALLCAGLAISYISPQPRADAGSAALNADLPSVVYSEASLADYRAAGTPVFVDFTAAWCVTCQVNKLTVLRREQVVQLFRNKGVVYMVADWTVQDVEITKALEAQGRNGVPLYLYYAPGAEQPQILPQILSRAIMEKTFSKL